MFAIAMALIFSNAAHAEDCNSKELTKALTEATPISSAKAFMDLHACDTDAAKKQSGAAFAKIISGSDANEAALIAIQLEEDATIRTWLTTLEPDEKSRAIASFGKACKEDAAVQRFFASTHAELGDKFWEDRWHRGLGDCRTESIQNILIDAVKNTDMKKDQSRFFTVLEIYSRNLGNKAVPTIAALADATDDQEHLTYLVNAMGDAANVGGKEGINPAAAKSAVEALVALGEKLPPRAVEQARKTLNALGAEEEADVFAGHRWRDRKENGLYRYAVTVTESGTCKNGKTFSYLHHATFNESGLQWPEQIGESIGEKLVFEWELSAKDKCKGEGEISVNMPSEPFASEEDTAKWVSNQKKAFESTRAGKDKSKVMGHEAFSY